MMTLMLAAVAIHQDATPNAAKIISDMLMSYRQAKTLTGTISLRVSDGKGQTGITTTVQYEKPSKLYIKQEKAGATAKLVTSDGKHFSYDLPENQGLFVKPGRLIESVVNGRGETQEVTHIYAASSASLFDRSTPLDIIISRKEDLEYINQQWATVVYRSQTEINGVKAHVVGGDWRLYGNSPVIGKYEFTILESGDLVRYVQQETYRKDGAPVTATYQYDVKVQRDGKPNQELFNVVL